MTWIAFEEREEGDGHGAVERSLGGFLAESGFVLLVKGGEGFEIDLFTVGDDFLRVVVKVVPVAAEVGVIAKGDGELSQGIEGSGLAEGLFEPFVIAGIGTEVGLDVGEFVSKLVNHLGPVALAHIELDDDFAAGAAIEQGDGAIGRAGDEKGWEVALGKGGDGEFKDFADLGFRDGEALGVDPELGTQGGGQDEKEDEEDSH